MKISLIRQLILIAVSANLLILPVAAEVRFSAGIEIGAASDFYEPLTPIGSWVEVGSYGRCWHPSVAVGWRPYTTGHWEWTDVGWYWVSDEPWAWACYHYGSWVNDPSYGWVWVPGVEWAPSWVTWRESPDYIGWAPCGPGGVVLAPAFFVFVDIHRFREPIRPDRVIVNNTTIVNRTTVVNNFRRETRTIDGVPQTVVANQGPSVTTIQKATGTRLEPVPVTQVVRNTPVPSTVKRGAGRDRTAQEPSRTGKEQPRTYQQAPTTTSPQPPAAVTPPAQEKEKPAQATEPRNAPLVPQRPQTPEQARPERPPGPPTGAERGYSRERGAPPAQAAPPRERPPGRETAQRPPGPAPEKDRGKGQDRDKEHP